MRVGTSTGTQTSQVANEVVESHFTLRFNVGRVHVGVEEDHGEGQDEDGVGVVKLLHHIWITHAVSLAEKENQDRGVRGVGQTPSASFKTIYR